jgi:predicted NUDIX family NTP pyrophosphohydrolase
VTKLRGHKGEEVGEGEGVELLAQRKSSRVVGEVIDDDQVILATRDTRNRGGPKVTVYEVKGLNGSSRGARKRQPNVST